MVYGARILAVLNYFKKFRGMKIGEQEARVKYLSQEEYMQVLFSVDYSSFCFLFFCEDMQSFASYLVFYIGCNDVNAGHALLDADLS